MSDQVARRLARTGVEARPPAPRRTPLRLLARLREVAAHEWSIIHPRLLLANFLLAFIPKGVGGRTRAFVYRRLLGMRIGRGTLIIGNLQVRAMGKPYDRLTIGANCLIHWCEIILNDRVTIGDNVTVSREVVITTDSHTLGPAGRRFGEIYTRPVRIEDGVWLTQRCIIHPGVTVGRGSVVANGAVVTRDVPPNVVAGGVPARVIRELPEGVPDDAVAAEANAR